MHRVACNDNSAIIGILMDAGADIYAKDNIGSTPLHTASFYGREASIQALLEGSSTGQSLILKDKVRCSLCGKILMLKSSIPPF